ncbi:ATP-binding protein [Carboxylicivirga taeanensis]|uniref:sensor histidine kinase n=1 Tax=Carboxylicivirga taeanensis TaxID=1416875 RepID=UPI003F6E1777
MERVKYACVLFIMGVMSLSAQNFAFQNYGVEEGLEHPFIESVVQDSTGYTWIGTTEGLYIFDGIYFDCFRHDVNDSTSISDNLIKALYVDPDKKVLWVGTRLGGINKLSLTNFKAEQIQRKTDREHKIGIGTVNVLSRYRNWLLIGTKENGLQAYHLEKQQFIDLTINRSRSDYEVLDLVHRDGVLFVGTDNGLYHYLLDDMEKGRLQMSKVAALERLQRANAVSFLNDSMLVVSSNTELVKYALSSSKLSALYQRTPDVAMLTGHIIDECNNIWLGTYGDGLMRLSPNGKLLNWHKAKVEDEALANNWVSSLHYSAKHKLLWVGTKDGLSMCTKNKLRFKHLRTRRNAGRMADNLFFLHKDYKNRYWWWTHTELYYKDGEKEPEVFALNNSKGLNQDTINCGYEDKQHILWAGSYEGLLAIDLTNDSYARTLFSHADVNARNLNIITSILPHKQTFWLVTFAGVIHFKSEEDYQVYPFPDNLVDDMSLRTTCAIIDNQGVLWIGDKEGCLTSFNPATRRFERYSSAVTTSQGKVRFNSIMDLHVQNDSTLFLATYGMGLLQFDIDNKAFAPIMENEMLSTNIYSIHKDREGFLWMNSNSRIIRFDLDTKHLMSFGRYDGVRCREFNQTSHFQGDNGEILMGGFGGFVEFNPNEFMYNTKVPDVDLGSYSVYNDREVIGGQVYDHWVYIGKDTLEINTEDKQISFYASVFNYWNANRNMIAWQLEGYEDNWDTLMAVNAKTYVSLPEGSYTLRVKASNNDQVWNEEGDSVVLIVKPPFTRSRLFKGIVILFMVILVYFVYILRIRYLNNQKKILAEKVLDRTRQLQAVNTDLEDSREEILNQKKELELHRYYLEELVKERTADLEAAKLRAEQADRLKTAFLANLSHEIRTPMNSIVGFSTLLGSNVYSAEERKEFASVIQKSSDSLLVLINDILDISRIETGQVALIRRDVDVYALCKDAFKSLRLSVKEGVRYELDMEGNIGDLTVCTDRERLKQVLINLLNNALKFTLRGHVRLVVRQGEKAFAMLDESFDRIQMPDNIVLFAIMDTGIGISEDEYEKIFTPFQKAHSGHDVHGGIGLGLSIVKQLVEMLGGKVWLRSQLQKGTTFYFYIPNNQNGYSESHLGNSAFDQNNGAHL